MGSEARARIGLAALLIGTLFGFEVLFARADYAGPALLGMLFATSVALLTRRVGLGTIATLGISTGALLWYLTIVFQAKQTFYGLPTLAALEGLGNSITRAYQSSGVDFAPIPVRPGYVVLVTIALWFVTTFGEMATFRWHRPFLASLPPIALFSFTVVVGTGQPAGFFVVAFLTALLSYWGLESAHRLRTWGHWVSGWRGHASEEPNSITGHVARRMGTLCILAALVAPLLLPALEEGVLAWRNNTGEGPGSGNGGGGGSLDLSLQLKPQLVEQSDTELFRVAADERLYWRIASLSRFDGNAWLPSDAERVAFDDLPADPAPGRAVTQKFDLIDLEGEYLPAAGTATDLEFPSEPEFPITVDPVARDLKHFGGIEDISSYEVTSIVPDTTFAELDRAKVGTVREGPELSNAFELSNEVEDLRDRWIRGTETPFQELVAIQTQLRFFEYSIDVEADASADYLTTFLTETRRGYCQQFATAFTLLSRSLGHPTRVSVGFLPGDIDGRGRYVVTGREAHAWPEVYFEGYGWVPFEPTPRSTLAQPPEYTSQLDENARLPSGVTGPLGGNAPETGTRVGPQDAGPQDATSPEAPWENQRWRETFGRVLAVVLVGVVAFLALVPLVKEGRVRRRYARARNAIAQARAAFAHFEDEAAELATPRASSESAVSYAARVALLTRTPRSDAVELAAIYEAAEYGPRGVTPEEASRARRLVKGLRGGLWSQASWWERARRLFSPLSLAQDLQLHPLKAAAALLRAAIS